MRTVVMILSLLFASSAIAQDSSDRPDFTKPSDVDLSPKGPDIKLEKDLGNDTSIGVGSFEKGDAFPKGSAPNVEPPSKFEPKEPGGGIILKKDF